MNIVGKMLVIFNLIFALVVGGFLIIDVGTRQQWKIAFEKLRTELNVARASNGDLSAKAKDLMAKLNDAEAATRRAEEKLKLDVAIEKGRTDQANTEKLMEMGKSKQADAQRQDLLANNNRLTQETKDLQELVKKKDDVIIAMENDIKTYRQEAFYHLGIAKSMQTRNEELLKQNRELVRKMSEKDATPLATAITKDPNAPNPPPAFVKGVVEMVNIQEGRPTLTQVSLGSDHGLKEGHTLDVYRIYPKAAYLGMMRLVDVKTHKAVGQMIDNGLSAGRPRIQVGDEVVSEIRVGQR